LEPYEGKGENPHQKGSEGLSSYTVKKIQEKKKEWNP